MINLFLICLAIFLGCVDIAKDALILHLIVKKLLISLIFNSFQYFLKEALQFFSFFLDFQAEICYYLPEFDQSYSQEESTFS